jgi:hypothetical protein
MESSTEPDAVGRNPDFGLLGYSGEKVSCMEAKAPSTPYGVLLLETLLYYSRGKGGLYLTFKPSGGTRQ